MAILETETEAPKPPWRRPLALIGWTLWAFFLLVTLVAHRNFPQIFEAARDTALYLLAAVSFVFSLLDREIAQRGNIGQAMKNSSAIFAIAIGSAALYVVYSVTTRTDSYSQKLRQTAALSELCADESAQSDEKRALCRRLVEIFPGRICGIDRPNAICRKELEPYLAPPAVESPR
jgi:hypothetical protein